MHLASPSIPALEKVRLLPVLRAAAAVLRRPAYDPERLLASQRAVLALFMPGGGVGAAPSMLIMVVMIGLLAAMAIPAFNKVRENSQMIACKNNPSLSRVSR